MIFKWVHWSVSDAACLLLSHLKIDLVSLMLFAVSQASCDKQAAGGNSTERARDVSLLICKWGKQHKRDLLEGSFPVKVNFHTEFFMLSLALLLAAAAAAAVIIVAHTLILGEFK
jgi:hypothetical protein